MTISQEPRILGNPIKNSGKVKNKKFLCIHVTLNHLSNYSTTRVEASKRKTLHDKRWNLPFLPTTTIGSFPQTKEVRSHYQEAFNNLHPALAFASARNPNLEKLEASLSQSVLSLSRFSPYSDVQFWTILLELVWYGSSLLQPQGLLV